MQTIDWQGKPIGLDGIYHGVPIETYHSAKACIETSISSSGLRTIFNESPAHYWDRSAYNPNRAPEERNQALNIGSAAHHLLLGETQFRSKFAVRPQQYTSYQTNESKAWRKTVEGKGFVALTLDDLEDIKRMADALFTDPVIKASGILNGDIERSIFHKEPKSGIWLKARPDTVPSTIMVPADLKTTTAVDFESLRRTIVDFRYDMQAALVRMLFRVVLDIKIEGFAFVFVTKKRPYLVQVVMLKEHDMDEAEQDVMTALQLFAQCFERKEWPGPNLTQRDTAYVEIGEWARKRATERRDYLKQELQEKRT